MLKVVLLDQIVIQQQLNVLRLEPNVLRLDR